FVLDRQFGMDQGFDSYDDRFDQDINSMGIAERRADETSRHAIHWLSRNKNRKFFLFLHYYDPHYTWTPPEPYASTYVDDPYAGEVAYTDNQIGRVLDKLRKLNIYDSTLIIIVGDHGELLGEYGETTHGFFIYQPVLRVPLLIRAPGRSEGRRISERAGLIDIMPTVCSLLGIQAPEIVQGIDLSCYFKDETYSAGEREFYCESITPTVYDCNPLQGLIADRWKYIHTTRPELYDLVRDPFELNNLMTQEPQQARILADKIRRIMETRASPITGDTKVVLDSESRTRLESLGYVSGSSGTDTFEYDESKDDPKDIIDFHELHFLAKLMLAREEYDNLRQIGERMLAERPGFYQTYYYLGNMAFRQGDDEKTVLYYRKFIEYDDRNEQVFNNLGLALWHLDCREEALECLERAVVISPDMMEAHYNLGMKLGELGRLEEALEHLELAYKLNPDDADVQAELMTLRDKYSAE
ncbi:MAG: sulfatase-like hydrolase/transferase, partial [Sedimentisphaerales bacterium]|nr:sulfatase-like hydrolase/transferase [Sedimentisphaerales bacterium]